jgi:hypothetical protein
MKFTSGELLYYVCPFIFTIEKIRVDMAVKEDDSSIYYIDNIGAYLREEDLFADLEEARENALDKLEKFFYERRYIILNTKPKLDEGY